MEESGNVLPLILRKKLAQQQQASGGGTAEAHHRPSLTTAAAASRSDDEFTAKELEQRIWASSIAVVEIQKQLYIGEEAYFDETNYHGNIFRGWDAFVDAKDVDNPNNPAMIGRRIPSDSRWFSGSCRSITRNTRPMPIQVRPIAVSSTSQSKDASKGASEPVVKNVSPTQSGPPKRSAPPADKDGSDSIRKANVDLSTEETDRKDDDDKLELKETGAQPTKESTAAATATTEAKADAVGNVPRKKMKKEGIKDVDTTKGDTKPAPKSDLKEPPAPTNYDDDDNRSKSTSSEKKGDTSKRGASRKRKASDVK